MRMSRLIRILAILFMVMTCAVSASSLESGIISIPSIDFVCCIRGYKVSLHQGDASFEIIRQWEDLQAFFRRAPSNLRKSLIFLLYTDRDFFLSAAYVYQQLMPESNSSVVWLPLSPAFAANLSTLRFDYLLAEIVEGDISDTFTDTTVSGTVDLNTSEFSHLSGVYSVFQATVVLYMGITLRHKKATSQFKSQLQQRRSQKSSMTKDEALRRLGSWGGVDMSYNAGVVLLGLQEVCIMLMVVYYFHWISYLLKVGFIAAFVFSTEMLLADFSAEGGRSVIMPLVGRRKIEKWFIRVVLCGVGIVWYLHRNEQPIWMLHNFMASCICVALISDINLPSMMVICLFASLLAVYDLFMVFITPMFTADGISVMESAVIGIDGEIMPMVMYTPKFSTLARYPQCATSRSGFLGLGDIIIPGIIGSYCALFDAMRMQEFIQKTRHIAVLAYFLGLVITYAFRELMDSAQPALIYIIPTMLLALLSFAKTYGIWFNFWNGHMNDSQKHIVKIE